MCVPQRDGQDCVRQQGRRLRGQCLQILAVISHTSALSFCLCMYTQLSNTLVVHCASLYHRFMFVYSTFSYFEQCTACCMSLLYLQTFNFPICVCAQTFHTLHITKINCAELVQGSWYICGDHTISYNGLRMNGRWHEVGWGVTQYASITDRTDAISKQGGISDCRKHEYQDDTSLVPQHHGISRCSRDTLRCCWSRKIGTTSKIFFDAPVMGTSIAELRNLVQGH